MPELTGGVVEGQGDEGVRTDGDCLGVAECVLRDIRSRCPDVRMIENAPGSLGMSVSIPVQPGVRHPIELTLQNRDELHLHMGNFWLEWFPCSDESTVAAFVDVVAGLLSGSCRVLEHYRGARCVKAELQWKAPEAGWTTFGTYSRFSLPFAGRKHYKVLINRG